MRCNFPESCSDKIWAEMSWLRWQWVGWNEHDVTILKIFGYIFLLQFQIQLRFFCRKPERREPFSLIISLLYSMSSYRSSIRENHIFIFIWFRSSTNPIKRSFISFQMTFFILRESARWSSCVRGWSGPANNKLTSPSTSPTNGRTGLQAQSSRPNPSEKQNLSSKALKPALLVKVQSTRIHLRVENI